MRTQQARFEASLDNLEPIGIFISDFMKDTKLPEEKIYNIEVSVDEHISNLVEHAHGDDAECEVTIICYDSDSRVQVIIEDKTQGFDPRHHSLPDFEGKTLYEIPPGGLGNFFICKLMDDVEYIHRPYVKNELILTMRKGTESNNS